MGRYLYRFSFILFIAFVLSAVDRCPLNESYTLGNGSASASASASGSESPTATPTATPDEDDGSVPTASASSSATATATASSTAESDDDTDTDRASVSNAILLGLRQLSDEQQVAAMYDSEADQDENDEPSKPLVPKPDSAGSLPSAKLKQTSGNWLGRIYIDEDQSIAHLDQDGDGFTDLLEQEAGSDEFSAESIPRGGTVTSLKNRLIRTDIDLDGIPTKDEVSLGTDINKADTDGDGFRDGSEKRAGTNPLNSSDYPTDTDGDGLGDRYEESVGLDPNDPDSDNDAMDDEFEIVSSTDPRNPDTDGDGILDGREVRLGSDPLVAESVG